MTKTAVLAVDPGTREFGVALFRGKELYDSGVKSLRRSGSPLPRLTVLSRVFTDLIERQRPTAVALEKNSFAHIDQNRMLMKAVRSMQAIAESHGVPAFAFAANTIKKSVTGDAQASKHAVARVICAQYPHLRAYLGHRYSWQERYYLNMFDAIACGLTYLSLRRSNQLQHYALAF